MTHAHKNFPARLPPTISPTDLYYSNPAYFFPSDITCVGYGLADFFRAPSPFFRIIKEPCARERADPSAFIPSRGFSWFSARISIPFCEGARLFCPRVLSPSYGYLAFAAVFSGSEKRKKRTCVGWAYTGGRGLWLLGFLFEGIGLSFQR